MIISNNLKAYQCCKILYPGLFVLVEGDQQRAHLVFLNGCPNPTAFENNGSYEINGSMKVHV